MTMQADLFRAPDAWSVPPPHPDATPGQVRMAHAARKLPPTPSAADYWRNGQFHNINLGVGPPRLRDMHGQVSEEWRRVMSVLDSDGEEIPISLGWWASDLGRIYYDGWRTGKSCWPDIIRRPSGHRSATLRGGVKIEVHRMVAAAYCRWPEPRRITGECVEVRHLDGDPSNNRADNLAFGTPRDNHRDAKRHGTAARPCLDADQVARILATMNDYSDHECARHEGVGRKTVWNIRTGRSQPDIRPDLLRRPTHPRAQHDEPAKAVVVAPIARRSRVQSTRRMNAAAD